MIFYVAYITCQIWEIRLERITLILLGNLNASLYLCKEVNRVTSFYCKTF